MSSDALMVNPDRPLEPAMLDVLKQAAAAANAHGVDFMVVGAHARDLHLHHIHGFPITRASRDIDLGLAVANWPAFNNLRDSLLATGQFNPAKGIAHRLIYQPVTIPLDIVPFGAIEGQDNTIMWPPEYKVSMNVAGFQEALQHASLVRIEASLAVKVASLPALAMLKLIAWKDRHQESAKDCQDFLLITRHYANADNLDRLYEQESALLEASGFDTDLAGAHMLGTDTAGICQPTTHAAILQIWQEPAMKQLFLDNLARITSRDGSGEPEKRALNLVQAFFAGFSAIQTP